MKYSKDNFYKNFDIFSSNQGLETEYFRLKDGGDISTTPHASLYGNPLYTPNITTDFSDALVELITDVHKSAEDTYKQIEILHKKLLDGLPEEEFIWYFSVPPIFKENAYVPIALYDMTDPNGRAKRLYRETLAKKYGEFMQSWSGIHYNVSFGDDLLANLWQEYEPESSYFNFVNKFYFKVARNFLRNYWLLLILLGNTPSASRSYIDFIRKRTNSSQDIDDAIALRTSEYGYLYSSKNDKFPSFNGIDDYIYAIEKLKNSPSKLTNDTIIQNENEIYLPIRMKSTSPTNSILKNLARTGVMYVEIRCLDYNPFAPFGVDIDSMHLIHAFLLWCGAGSDEAMSEYEFEFRMLQSNEIAMKGRKNIDGLFDTKIKGLEILADMKAMLETSSDILKDKYLASIAKYSNILENYDLPALKLESEFPMSDFDKAIEYSKNKTSQNRKRV